MLELRTMRVSWLCVGLALGSIVVGCASEAEASSTNQNEEQVIAPPAPTEPPLPGTGSVSGDLAGSSVNVVDAAVFVGSLSAREPDKHGARIVLASQANTCGKPDVLERGGAVLTLDVPIVDGAPLAGTYFVPKAARPDASSVVAHLEAAGDDCFRRTIIVSGGSLTIDEARSGRVRGSFSLSLGHDTITGTFDAAPCTGSAPPLSLRCQ